MRIAIVNDLLIAIEALRRVIATVPDYELAWIAQDGAEAVTKCQADTPDLILMDLLMPVMDGIEATRRIMAQSPCAILLVTASVNTLAPKVFEAMGYGALDTVRTPVLGLSGQTDGGTGLLNKIATIAKLLGKSPRQRSSSAPEATLKTVTQRLPPLIVIGASTGGPQALAKILSQFPANFRAAVVIVQHVDAQFAPSFANWLDSQTALSVQLAGSNCQPEPGKVWVAGTNNHLVMHADRTLGYTSEPQNCSYRPSIDVFFNSVATHWLQQGTGILLTGMGKDGAAGLAKLRTVGWHTIAQDQATSIVYGMPKVAAAMGAAVDILAIDAIGAACLQQAR
jgi:two-component system response regulator WspF